MDTLATGEYAENEHTVRQRMKATVWWSPGNRLMVSVRSLRAQLSHCPVLCEVMVGFLVWGERRSD